MSTDDRAAYPSNQRGKKVSVSAMPGETSDEFAARAMAMLFETEAKWVLNMALDSASDDWEAVPSERSLEVRHRTDQKLWLRLTTLRSDAGGVVVGHLVIDWDGRQLVDKTRVTSERGLYSSWTDTGDHRQTGGPGCGNSCTPSRA